MNLRIYILTILIGVANVVSGQFMAGGDTTICEGGQAQLWATGGGASYFWISDPPDPSILNPQTQNPIVSPNVTTMYICRTNIATGNLIFNGSFEAGNSGFSSEYIYSPGSIYAEGTYAVVSDANTVHSNFFCDEDHTTGYGLFMAVNGSGVPNVQVWYLNLPSITPNTDYEFSTWITSLHPANPATLQFSINGVLLGNPFQAYSSTCDWYQFFEVWNSGSNTSASISIVNQNTFLSGNDFALDDISFAEVEVFYDTVWVYVVPQYNSNFTAEPFACTQQATEIIYSGDAPDTAVFSWDFDGGTILSGSGPGPYNISWNETGTKEVSLEVNPDACPSGTTTHPVEVHEEPISEVTADATLIPYGTSTILHGTYSGTPGPLTFSWSPEVKVSNPSSPDPETVPLEESTLFEFTVTDETTGCTSTSGVLVSVTGGPLAISLEANPQEICQGETSQLSAHVNGGTGNNSYSWTSDPPGFISDLPDPVVSPLQTTTYIVQIDDGLSVVNDQIEVLVHPLPVGNPGSDMTIPYGTSTVLSGSASGGSGQYLYHWEPAEMLIDPDMSTPTTHNLYLNTQFTFTVTDEISGCIGEEVSMIVNLDGGPLSVGILGESEICSGKTIILTASANGGDPSGYIFQWTDDMGGSYPDHSEIEVTPGSTTTFFVTVDDGFNISSAQFEVIVNPTPLFQLSSSGQIKACPYDSIVLSPSETSDDWKYLWSNGSTESSIKVGSTGIGYDLKEYALTISTESECIHTEQVQVLFEFSVCLGIEEQSDKTTFNIFPNPSNGEFTILTNGMEIEEIIIFDGSGRNVYHHTKPIQGDRTSLHTILDRGIYFIYARRYNQSGITQKLIIH